MERAATRLGAAVALVALLGAVAAFYAIRASGAEHVRVVMTATNKTLGKKILVNRKGMSLYSLSVERNGRFVCTTKTCLSLWKPLTIARGLVATGVAHLGVVNVATAAGTLRIAAARCTRSSGTRRPAT